MAIELIVVMSTANRPNLFKDALKTLARTRIPGALQEKTTLIITADAPGFNVSQIVKNVPPSAWKKNYELRVRGKRMGCDRGIVESFEYALKKFPTAQWVINIEEDSLFDYRWLGVLWSIKNQVDTPGAYCVYNSHKHPAYHRKDGSSGIALLFKRTIGGFGAMMRRSTVAALVQSVRKRGIVKGWDWMLCDLPFVKEGRPPFVATHPSFIQHTGKVGVHTVGDENFDHARDFVGRANK